MRRACLIIRIVDLVKAVNAWNHSALGNVLPMPQSKLSLCLCKRGFVGVWSKVSGEPDSVSILELVDKQKQNLSSSIFGDIWNVLGL